MANKEAQIKPTGMSQRNLVDLMYMIVYSFYGICTKLDSDGGVPSTTYVANVLTAICNGSIENSRGDVMMRRLATKDDRFYIASPTGIMDRAINEWLYQVFDMMETLTEQLDGDSLTDTNYEALCYTALYTWMVEDQKGNIIGNGHDFYFNPGGVTNQKELVDCLAQIVNSIDVLTQKLDDDGTVTDTNYEALWDTAVILMQIEDSKGNVYGNALTKFMP
jgi:hypothetical protein